MSSALHTIKYPTGVTEFRVSEKPPAVGDILTRDGDTWIVEEVHTTGRGTTAVTLRARPSIERDSEDQ